MEFSSGNAGACLDAHDQFAVDSELPATFRCRYEAMFRVGSTDEEEIKRTASHNSICNMSLQDCFGYVDAPETSSHLETQTRAGVGIDQPSAQQKRIATNHSTYDEETEIFMERIFDIPNISPLETAEDKLEKIRTKNRQAQKRFRAKKKARSTLNKYGLIINKHIKHI